MLASTISFEWMIQYFQSQPLVLLFVTVGLGYLGHHLSFRGVSFGIASVLFVGLALGAMGGAQLVLPEFISQLGIVLFIYSMGLHVGPSFFGHFKRHGVKLLTLAILAVGLSAFTTRVLQKVFGFSAEMAAGLFTGALTNTPALALVNERIVSMEPSVGYAIAYPLAVILPIAFTLAVRWWQSLELQSEAKKAERLLNLREPANSLNIVYEKNMLTLGELIEVTREFLIQKGLNPAIKVSRVSRQGVVTLGIADFKVKPQDILHVVAAQESLNVIAFRWGTVFTGDGPESDRGILDFRRMVLTQPKYIGRSIKDSGIELELGIVITRVRRGDVDFVPESHTLLEKGDRLRIVTQSDRMEGVSQSLGDSLRALSETDFASVSLGILLGILLGEIEFPYPGGSVRLGAAGGSLLVSLFLGWKGRTGRWVWSLPSEVSLTFRQFGLLLFFAAVGLKAGYPFLQAIHTQGLTLLLAGACITAVSTAAFFGGAYFVFKWDWISSTATLAGGQTQPAILGFLEKQTLVLGKSASVGAQAAQSAYVAMMPVAMVLKIILAQLLL